MGTEKKRPEGVEPSGAETELPPGRVQIFHEDNLAFLERQEDQSFDLVYIDPPFNTGRVQERSRLRTVRDEAGDRTGFGGKRYRTETLGSMSFEDQFDDFLGFLGPRLEHAWRVLKADGSLFLHLDPRESHYAKVFLDQLFGRSSFMNEIIWAYDYGARSKKKWSSKHDVILWYARDPSHFTYRYEDIDRVPYMAPGLVGPEKAARGKTPTDVWWNTIVSPNGKERTGYPTQKPLKILSRIIRVHSNPGDRILDFFAGSGTTGEAAALAGRDAVLVDSSVEAVDVMSKRLGGFMTCESAAGEGACPDPSA